MTSNQEKLPAPIIQDLDRIVSISKHLRKERELAFYGDEDYLPSEEYSEVDGQNAITNTEWLLTLIAPWVGAALK